MAVRYSQNLVAMTTPNTAGFLLGRTGRYTLDTHRHSMINMGRDIQDVLLIMSFLTK